MSSQFGKFKVDAEVGSGDFGKVYLALKDGDKTAYILKTLKEECINEDNIKLFKKEIDILIELNKEPKSDYIPNLFGFNKENIDKFRPYYVIDFISKGNLFYYLERANYNLPERCAKLLFKKIVKGIQFCHNRNICHLDIKPLNIMLDKHFNPIIIDFGLSDLIKNEKNETIIYKGKRGTQEYKSPEMWDKFLYKGVESDIFSLGVVLFNLMTGKVGFLTSKKNDYYYKLIINNNGNDELYWEKIKTQIKKEFSKEFKELYFQMVALNPSERPSIENILNSNWLKEINNLNEEEENKLENEVQEYLEELYKEIKDEDDCELEIEIAEKMKEKGYNTREGDNEKKYFYDNLRPKKISDLSLIINHHLILNGSFDAVDFMNSLAKEINNKFEDKILFEESKESLKLKLMFEKDEEDGEDEEVNNCIIDIELFECENGKYLLNFLRTGGEVRDYYRYFKIIKEIIIQKIK